MAKSGRPLERDIENEFASKVRELGCKCYKFEVKGEKGVADRLVFIPGGTTILIEFKRLGCLNNTTPHQKVFLREMKAMGFAALATDSYDYALSLVKAAIQLKYISTSKDL